MIGFDTSVPSINLCNAGSCPMLAKNIDDKIKKAQELKDQGMDAHNNGDHAKSEKLLNEALALFKS